MADKRDCQPRSHALQVVLRSGQRAMGRNAGKKILPSDGAVTPDVFTCTDEVNSCQTGMQPRAGWRSSGPWEPTETRWDPGYGSVPIRPAPVLRECQHRAGPEVFLLEQFSPTVDRYIPLSSIMRFECRT